MDPIKITYDICRCYLNDLHDVDPALISLVRGYMRSRNLAGLTSCTDHFDLAKHSSREWRALRQIEAFFKKNSIFSNPKVCAQAAMDSFMANERTCAATNRRLKTHIGYERQIDGQTGEWVNKARHYIRNVLGDHHAFLNELPRLVKVTPGATASSSRKDSLPQMKMKLRQFCPRGAAIYVKALGSFLGFDDMKVAYTYSNRVELVPKNWKTDRTIACEPEGSLPFQLAFDSWTKRKLKQFGIDLRNQFANQQSAKEGSTLNDRVTVDFKAASDTISYNTVSMLFPIDWFNYLDRLRSPMYRGTFGKGVYSKFSSMGNGSTFCIETLIFAAACHAVGAKEFLVYGDDVIIEKKYFADYLKFTQFLGFTINEEKSFADGPFRESCGGDYYDGIDVTPIYIRNIDQRKAVLCHLVNSMATLTYPGSELASYLHKLMDEYKLPLVPENESTLSGVWIDADKARNLGLLKSIKRVGPYIEVFKAYQAFYTLESFEGCRGYYLWHFRARKQVTSTKSWDNMLALENSETSTAPIFKHKYVRKWVRWQKPPMASASHLLWW